MKRDPYFKFLVVIILAGLILAFVNPAPLAATAPVKIPVIATHAGPPPAKS